MIIPAGRNARISNNGLTATRPNALGEFNDAIVMSRWGSYKLTQFWVDSSKDIYKLMEFWAIDKNIFDLIFSCNI